MPSWRIPWATKEFEPVKVSEIETGGGVGREEGGREEKVRLAVHPYHLNTWEAEA